jgi:hypothetical protein
LFFFEDFLYKSKREQRTWTQDVFYIEMTRLRTYVFLFYDLSIKEKQCCSQVILLTEVDELKNNGLGTLIEIEVDDDLLQSICLVLVVLVVLNHMVLDDIIG